MNLITGYRGFIGSRLMYILQNDHGQECDGLEKDDLFSLYMNDCIIEYLQDMGITRVYHLGAITDTTYRNEDIFVYNTEISGKLFEATHKLNIRTMFASSAAIYGNYEYPIPCTPYALSKLLAEYKSINYRNVVSLRYFNVFGPGEENKGKMASVLYQAWKANQEGKIFKLFRGSDHMMRDFIYIDDVVSTTILVMENEDLVLRVLDVGTMIPETFVTALELMGEDMVRFEVDPNLLPPMWFQGYTSAGTRWVSARFVPMYDEGEWLLEDRIGRYKTYLKGMDS